MTQFWRNSLDVAAALGAVLLGTLIVHLVMTWWSASAALHWAGRGGGLNGQGGATRSKVAAWSFVTAGKCPACDRHFHSSLIRNGDVPCLLPTTSPLAF